MEQSAATPAPVAGRLIFWLGFFALLTWQAWLTLGLFGEYPWQNLVDDKPIVSGRHPQHLYLGFLGAQSLDANGSCCVYDPAFHAAYPKTPIFNGCRLAELLLFLGGATYQPAVYKIGLAVACLLVPLLVVLAGRAAGLDRSASLLAGVVSILLWWGPIGRTTLEAGDSDVFFSALWWLAHLGLLVRFHRYPSLLSWILVFATAFFGWLSHPLLFVVILPLFLGYYLMAGPRHGSLTWHLALWGAQVLAVAANLIWLIDWVNYWWLRAPLPVSSAMLPHRTFATMWNAPLWAGPVERGLAIGLLASGLAGVLLLHFSAQRPAARLWFFGALALLVLAFLGVAWDPLGRIGTSSLFLPALWFAALPAAHAWVWLGRALSRQGAAGGVALTLFLAGAAVAAFWWRDDLSPIAARAVATEPLLLGLNEQRQDIVDTIVQHTGAEARILWEDRALPRTASRWSALLPYLTNRYYMGGLDSDCVIEHSSFSFVNGALEGRPIRTWSDEALEEYCKRYNVGWIVAWSPAVLERVQQWAGAVEVTSLFDDVPGNLFMVRKAERNYALKGKAQIVQADSQRIILADVVPEDGVVVLSLHYQNGLRALPSRVQVERERCGQDPIGFVRLRVAGPVARVTITWGAR
ncbi:MAG: hypothetical protein L0Y72_13930 [Gemmataceae bacterium]|nr:hypothetical protein [Gemmataceae bacterium]MCI0740141.1 hypothetical protein [Gemmataceae bacterium]